MEPQRIIRVFIASPGDLAEERRAFKDQIEELNQGYGRGARVEFVPLGWEDAFAGVSRRAQDGPNKQIDDCDVFILAMWRRWGQPAPDAKPYSSYTEEEYYRALARYNKTGAPVIIPLFKRVDPAQEIDAGRELKKVLTFRDALGKRVMYRYFKDAADFKKEIDRHLVAFHQGRLDPTNGENGEPLVPDSIRKLLDDLKAQVEEQRAEKMKLLKEAQGLRAAASTDEERLKAEEGVTEARAEVEELELVERAAKAGLEGNVEAARQGFARVLADSTNLRVLSLGSEFYYRIGELDEAERLVRRCLAFSDQDSAQRAVTYRKLGTIMKTRGDLDLDRAEAMHRDALKINEKLVRCEAMARDYGNLGIIMKTRGNLDGAEAMYGKALEINQKLSRVEDTANNYADLGNVLFARGDLDGAEAMYRKALEINERHSRDKAMIINYGNLGNLLFTRGDFGEAEAMYRKALEINKNHSRDKATNINYGNLGNVPFTRGEPNEAQAKPLEINERLGCLKDMANDYANPDAVASGDVDGAEATHRKVLDIDEELGRLDGITIIKGNLSKLLESRGKPAEARKLRTDSHNRYAKLGVT